MSVNPTSAKARRAARLVVVMVSASLCGGCFVRQMIYPAPAVPVPSPPPGPLEEVELALADGTTVSAWHLPVEERTEEAGAEGVGRRPAVLFFHGNGENLGTMLFSGFFEDLSALGVPGLVVDYPGYGRSGGRPSEAALAEAADEAGAWLERRYPDRPLVVAGWSLGAAVAFRQATDAPRRWQGLVALSPWTSLPEIARTHFPGWLVGLALSERYDSLAVAPTIGVPSLLAHGREDRIISVEHGRRVAEAIPGVVWIEVPGAGHNDLLARPEIWSELSRFLGRIAARP